MPDLLSIETWRNIFTKHASKLGWGLAAVIGLPLIAQFGMGQFAGRGNPAREQNLDMNATVATVNGVAITRREYEATATQNRGEQTAEQKAQARGSAINDIAQGIIVQQEATARKVTADDATVDRAVQQAREQYLGPDASNDSKWSSFLSQGTGMTPSEFRANMAKRSIGPALLESYKSEIKVTPEDAKKQTSQAKLQVVLIGAKGEGPMAAMDAKNPKILDAAAAKANAESVLAQAKSGADLAALAKANSTDPSAAKGGTVEFRPEYGTAQLPTMGLLGYGPEFDDAVHQTALGQLTPVVKAGGFTSGYLFAKVLERKNDLPKDFNATKVADTLKEQQAKKKLEQLILDKTRAAKIEVTDPTAKTYYDYFRLQRSQNSQMMQFQLGEEAKKDQLPKDQEMALATSVEAGFEKILKDDPSDSSVALVLAEFIKKKPRTDATRDRLISLYETALKGSESQPIRLELASLYREKKDYVKSKEQYDTMARLQSRKPVYNTQSANEAITNYKQLITAYKSVNAPADATKLEPKLTEAQSKLLEYQLKEKKAEQEQLKKQPPPVAPTTPKK